jgi:hypothetical protein
MIQNILHSLGSIDQYGIISLCLFCSIFIGVLLWAILQKKSHLDHMARAALDADTQPASLNENSTPLTHE